MNDNLPNLDRDALIAQLQQQLVEKEQLLETAIAERNRAMFKASVTHSGDQSRSEAASRASRWKWNNWVHRTFPDHYDRIATEIHGAPSDDPKVAYMERWSRRRVSYECLREDKALTKAIADRRRAKRREQQRLRREQQHKSRISSAA